MRTARRLLVVPALLVMLVSCGSSKAADDAGTTVAARATSVAPATTSGARTTAAKNTTAAPGATGDEKPVSGEAAEIVVRVGKDDSPSRVEHVDLGQTVELRLISDGDEEYHVHGYDLEGKAAAGVEYDFNFTADMAGRFEVESHTTDTVLLVLEVS